MFVYSENSIRFAGLAAYRVRKGKVDRLKEFDSIQMAAKFFGLYESTVSSKASTNHRVRDRDRNLWFLFSGSKDYDYIANVINNQNERTGE